jgi:hypothetical protein
VCATSTVSFFFERELGDAIFFLWFFLLSCCTATHTHQAVKEKWGTSGESSEEGEKKTQPHAKRGAPALGWLAEKKHTHTTQKSKRVRLEGRRAQAR